MKSIPLQRATSNGGPRNVGDRGSHLSYFYGTYADVLRAPRLLLGMPASDESCSSQSSCNTNVNFEQKKVIQP
nr:MAG TPA: hypothetical protein [Caudoviricetes sp.]DAQ90318.1 MAG TPA: hypothetical protein [Caudoviricetes sp.]